MSCAEDFRNLIEFYNCLSRSRQPFLIEFEVWHKASMNEATRTTKIRLHFKVEVFNPVLSIVAASPRSDHGLSWRIIPYVRNSLCDAIFNIGNVNKPGIFGSGAARPGFHTIFGAECDCGIRGIFCRQYSVVAIYLALCLDEERRAHWD